VNSYFALVITRTRWASYQRRWWSSRAFRWLRHAACRQNDMRTAQEHVCAARKRI